MSINAQFATPALIFALTLASGVWLSRSGKPFPAAIFTMHKLIALAAVIVTARQVNTALQKTEMQALLGLLLAGAASCTVLLFVTGALMSRRNPVAGAVLTVHKASLCAVAGIMAVTVYLLPAG